MARLASLRVVLGLVGAGLSGIVPGAENAVILLYHHVADDAPASTSVTRAEFAAQLDYLEREDFTVMPLAELIAAIRGGEPVPERSVAISFDDAYRSILSNAAPLLEARGWRPSSAAIWLRCSPIRTASTRPRSRPSSRSSV